MPITLNRKGDRYARKRIKAGAIDADSSWEFAAADENKLLGDPPDWSRFSNYFLGLDQGRDAETKARFKYPFAKKGNGTVKVYRSAIRAIRTRAAQQDHTEIFRAAGGLLELLDEAQGRSAERRRAYTGPAPVAGEDPREAGDLVFCRAAAPLEIRAAGDRERLEGYAAVFDTLSEPMIWGREKIARGAFAEAIKSGADVIANLEHEGGLNVIGRRSNETLELAEDDHGLRVVITPPDTQTGRDVVELVRGGYLRQMSFAFRVLKQELDDSGDELIRTLLDVELYDVAVVALPAYAETTVEIKRTAEIPRDTFDGRLRILELAERRRLTPAAAAG